ncbi:MAG: hypothetical protein FD175_490 [Beijerinckiaceae bacterium]|nr:MAG: hypothetical protein FD175_490 [Beijerinckiaceae bacterium]
MSVLSAMLLGLAMGAIFGMALEKGRVCEGGVIVCQMQMSRHAMLKMFLSAVITGLIVLSVMVGFGLAKLSPKATLFAADIVGGAILGVGIVIAGACPGTVLAQIGTGYKDAIFTFIGGLFGALAFTYMEPNILKPVLTSGAYGKLTLDQLLGLPFPAVALSFAAILIGLLVWLEKVSPWREEIGPNADGVPAESPPKGAMPAKA